MPCSHTDDTSGSTKGVDLKILEIRKSLACLFILLLLVFAGCGEPIAPTPDDYLFSFEHDMEEWIATGTDLDNPPVEWSIERSQDIASNGKTAVRLYLNNMNDEGKIWIERPFNVAPDRVYQVRVQYDLASADWGDVNLWTIITGVVPKSPRLELVYQGHTGNNAKPEDGFVWLHKSYNFTTQSGLADTLYVMIGVWGTWETARTYYLDNVSISFTARS